MSQDIIDVELVERVPSEDCVSREIEIADLPHNKVQLANMVALGGSVKDIAMALSRSEAWVRQYKKDPDVKDLIQSLQQEALDQAKLTVTYGASKAARTLCDLLENANPGIQLAAARDVLDRLGLKAVERKEVTTNVNINVDPEERRKLLLERLRRLEMDD